MAGILIEHETARSLHTVVVMAKPYRTGPLDCPVCMVLHPVKTVHLWFNSEGKCLVSEGVLEELRMAGMPGLSVVGWTDTPPSLKLFVNREKQDAEHRKQIIYQSDVERVAL